MSKSFPFYLTDINAESGSYVVRRKHASLGDSDDDRRERASLRDSDDVSVLCPGKCHLVSKFIKSREPSMESFTARYTVYPILQNFEKP